jgi:hypothetical protein
LDAGSSLLRASQLPRLERAAGIAIAAKSGRLLRFTQRYFVMMPEQVKVLAYLRRHFDATVRDMAAACFKGAAVTWVSRVRAELTWLGCVAVFIGSKGEPAALQITQQGLREVAIIGRHRRLRHIYKHKEPGEILPAPAIEADINVMA